MRRMLRNVLIAQPPLVAVRQGGDYVLNSSSFRQLLEVAVAVVIARRNCDNTSRGNGETCETAAGSAVQGHYKCGSVRFKQVEPNGHGRRPGIGNNDFGRPPTACYVLRKQNGARSTNSC